MNLTQRLVAGAVAVGSALAGLGVLAEPAHAASSVQITRVYVNSPGNDLPTSNAKVNAEYTMIKNTSRSSVTLTNWTLRDKSNHVYKFGKFTLGAGKTVVVRNGKGTNTSSTRYWGSTYYIWNNSGGDSATLRGSSGAVADTCSWGTVSSYRNC